jgi:sec-independent protein translocase protein TatA
MFGNPTEIALLVAAAAVLFGAERIPKLARGLGQAKKEFQMGQAEADVEAERIRAEARAKAEAAAKAAPPAQAPAAADAAGTAAPVPTPSNTGIPS